MEYRLFKDTWLMGVKNTKCSKCHNKFNTYVDLSDFESPGCLKCGNCKKYFIYDILDPIFIKEGIEKLPYTDKKTAIEKILSPCKICGGILKHYDLSANGFPDECPKCGSKNLIKDEARSLRVIPKERIEVTKIGFNLDKNIPNSSFAHQQWKEDKEKK